MVADGGRAGNVAAVAGRGAPGAGCRPARRSGTIAAAMKQDVNLAICGHAWHGKSTLIGKTAVELGMVGRRRLQHFEELARQGRDPSLIFALMVFRQKDVTHRMDEAARGITVLPSFVRFEFERHRVTVIDTPGQETYTNNRFAGMFSADCALLVVDVKEGVEKVTEQALRVLRGYEIPLRGVAITKMDRVNYAQQAFEECVELVRLALRSYDLPDEEVVFIPTSAYAPGRPLLEPGVGLTARSRRLDWYDGPTFHDFMAGLDLRVIRPESPLRIVIHSADIHEQVPGVGTAFTGLVESGTVRRDDMLIFEPSSRELGEPLTASVRSLELTRGHLATPGIGIEQAHPRQLIGVALRQISTRASLRELWKGHGTVAGHQDEPPSVASELEVEAAFFDHDLQVHPGQHLTLHVHMDRVSVEILSLDPGPVGATPAARGRKERDKGDVTLVPGQWVKMALRAVRPVAIEEASRLAPLSKVVFRLDNRPIGIGRCVRILRR
ncbi:MAG: elongation factor 1-alpha [Planctomycetota bacterium]|nr:MAG: elongation factor 1-alpha [Planctomycetota bacterium]